MIAALTNHLWQSTLFVLAAALVAAALRKNGAHIRHRVWLVASLKFLVPFSVLMSLGGALPSVTLATTTVATSTAPSLSVAVDRLARPFTDDVFFESSPATATQPPTNWTAVIIAGTWASGFFAVAFMRLRGWRRIRAAVRASTPVPFASERVDADLKVRATSDLLEPGVVGLWRPILLVPAGIEEQLTPPQLDAVLEHELCHVQRRDNLTSAIHMVVEAAFWFHPLVWFVGARLVDERERACDEHVLRVCGEPHTYAESILNVCKLYVESPVACVSGVSGPPKLFFRGGGADLKKRIAAIIGNRIGLQLNLSRKVALAAVATLAVILPLAAGMLIAPLSAYARASAGQAQPAGPAQSRPQTRDALAAQAAADKAAGKSPKFDVVSIKPCPGLQDSGPGRAGAPNGASISPGYVHFSCITLGELIDQVYTGPYVDSDGPLLNSKDGPIGQLVGDHEKRVRGGPSWVQSDRWTIEMKMTGDATDLTSTARFIYMRAALNPALRAMVEDRFQLKLHRATEQVPMYGLAVAKDGLKMVQSAPAKCWERPVLARGEVATPPPGFEGTPACGFNAQRLKHLGNEVVNVTNGSMQGLAGNLSMTMDRFVLDKTGVDGRFTFTFEYASDENTPGSGFGGGLGPEMRARLAANAAAMGVDNPHPQNQPKGDGPTIFKALEKLGLVLEKIKGPAEYYQIDSVQRPRPDLPSEIVEAPARAQGAGKTGVSR